MPKNIKIFLLRIYCSFNFSGLYFNQLLPLQFWGRKPSPSPRHHSGPWSPWPSLQAQEHHSKPLLRASGAPSFRYSPSRWRDGTSGKQQPAPRTYLKARIGNQARVVTEICCVMLHHPLRLRLAEMFVRRGKAARREHYRRAFWKQQYEKGKGSELHILHSELIRTTKGNPPPTPPFSHPSECKAHSSFSSWPVREGRKLDISTQTGALTSTAHLPRHRQNSECELPVLLQNTAVKVLCVFCGRL